MPSIINRSTARPAELPASAIADFSAGMQKLPHVLAQLGFAVQVVLDAKMVRAADVVAKRQKVNRSALIREALADHLKRIHIKELEERERKGYEAIPERPEDAIPFEMLAWPDDMLTWPD